MGTGRAVVPLLVCVMCSSCVVLQVTSNDTIGSAPEVRLKRHLLAGQDNHTYLARPRVNHSEPVRVKFGLRLVKARLIEKDNILVTSVWARYKWFNHFLTWEPSKFGGVKRVTLPANKIWIPDIHLVNTAKTSKEERYADVGVSHNGYNFWAIHAIYRSSCHLDMTEYPYDAHACHLWFQSLSHRDQDLQLEVYGPSPPFDMSTSLTSFRRAGEWKVSRNSSEWVSRPRDMDAILVFSRRNALRFSLTLERQAGFTAYLVLLPVLLLDLLTLVVFCLPPERPDRNSLATSLFGAFMVLLLVLVKVAPPTPATVPKIVILYSSSMVLVILSVPLSALVGRTRKRRGHMPALFKTVFIDAIGSLLFACLPPVGVTVLVPHEREAQQESANHISPVTEEDAEVHQVVSVSPAATSNTRNIYYTGLVDRSFRFITGSKKQKKKTRKAFYNNKQKIPDWVLLGVVFDRLFFVAYSVCIVVIFSLFYPQYRMPSSTEVNQDVNDEFLLMNVR